MKKVYEIWNKHWLDIFIIGIILLLFLQGYQYKKAYQECMEDKDEDDFMNNAPPYVEINESSLGEFNFTDDIYKVPEK